MKDPDQLSEGWISGSLSEEEVEMLLKRLGEDEADSTWPELIDAFLRDAGMAGRGNALQRERLFQQLMKKGRQQEVILSGTSQREMNLNELHLKELQQEQERRSQELRKRVLMRTIRWVAAAVLILLAVSGYWWYNSIRSNRGVIAHSPASPQPDLMPGSNKAILTLGNGSTIMLDSSAKGVLAQQSGTTIFKSDSGQIAYKQTAEAGHSKSGVGDLPSGRSHAPIFNTLTTPRGGQYKLVLPDGSGVWLNAASSITYPTVFAGNERKVQVTGEVYFEVAKIPSMPFRVQAKDMEVTVLGTHFDINGYEDEVSINTTLLEGAVKISTGEQQKQLEPGQQAQLQTGGQFKIIPAVDMDAVMAWKNGYFSFHHTDLKTVMRQLARWYDVSIEYRGTIPDMKFGGDIPRSANASQVLHILEESKIHCTIEGNKIVVTP